MKHNLLNLVALSVLLPGLFGLTFSPSVYGQLRMFADAPSQNFRAMSLTAVYQGDFKLADTLLNQDLRSAVKIPNREGRQIYWLDSLCYWTMIGEVHFQSGRYDEAFNAFNAGLQIYFDHPDWLKKISVGASPRQLSRKPFPWGTSSRQGGVGDFNPCHFLLGQESTQMVAPGGGAQPGLSVQKAETRIQADMIVQCMALMIRRRAELLGTLSKYDPLTKKLAAILESRPCLPNHFTGTWVDVLNGLVLSAMGDDAGAETSLNRGLLMLNAFDHHLTADALNELGHISLRKGNAAVARNLYLEASYAAYWNGSPILLGETFRNAANAQRLAESGKPFQPILDALTFFSQKRERETSPFVVVPLCLETSEYAIARRDIRAAGQYIEQADSRMRKTHLNSTALGARLHYLSATIDYANAYANFSTKKQAANLTRSGDDHLDAALGILKWISLRQYQLSKLESFFQNGQITSRGPITERIADDLYGVLLRESTVTDWALNPMECFAALAFTPPTAYERWFIVAAGRGNKEKAFNIAEQARRAKFFAALPLGGSRLLAFRQLFETPEEKLSPELLLQRQTLAIDFREFKKRSDKVQKIKEQLARISIAPSNRRDIVSQKDLLQNLESESMAQEAMLRPMALSRAAVPSMFPQVLTLEEIRRELPEKTSMLVFSEALGSLFGFLIDRNSLAMWEVVQEKKKKTLDKLISDYVRSLGNKGTTSSLTLKEISDTEAGWKKNGAELLTRLLGDENRSAGFSELVIVPAGTLWYVPFESMCVKVGNQDRPLLTAGENPLTIRYAPMASLGVPNFSGRTLTAETLVLLGKLKSSDSVELAQNAFDRFKSAGIKGLVGLSMYADGENKVPEFPCLASTFESQIKKLVVLDDIPKPANNDPLGWSPFSYDKKKKQYPISTWLALPYGGPQLIVLPAFHTETESGLKEKKRRDKDFFEANGDDLFLSSMVLKACGANTVLLSRWKTGGRSAFDLTEQFLKNYPAMPAAEAWRQAVLSVGSSPVQLSEEPRIQSAKKNAEDAAQPPQPIANHPFFWSGYILIDCGEKPDEPSGAESL